MDKGDDDDIWKEKCESMEKSLINFRQQVTRIRQTLGEKVR